MFHQQPISRRKGREPRRQPGLRDSEFPSDPIRISRDAAAVPSTVIAFVPQLVQEESCKFSFVSSTLTEGCDLITQSVEYTPFKRRCVGSNPTEVINRLVVQWTEQLGSNEKALGSNPSKAEASPISSVDRARCYERRLSQVRILHGGPTSEGAGSVPTNNASALVLCFRAGRETSARKPDFRWRNR
jgi:hypothetical protein